MVRYRKMEVLFMKPAYKIALIVFVVIFLITGVFSLLGSVLRITFGVIGAFFSFIWRVIFTPIILIVFVIWLVNKFVKKPPAK